MLYFLSKLDSFTKLKKGIVLTLVFLIMKTKRKYPIYVSKKYFQQTCWFIIDRRKRKKATMFVKNILIRLCTIIHYTAEENNFVFIVYKLLVRQEYLKPMLLITLKLMVNK